MLPCQRHLFDIPDNVAYLNCAYMSPLMKAVVEAGRAGLARKAHPWGLTPDEFFTGTEEFRRTAALIWAMLSRLRGYCFFGGLRDSDGAHGI